MAANTSGDTHTHMESAGYGSLHRQTRTPFGPATSQHTTAILCAHALAETVLAFFLEVGWLLKCE